MAVGLAFAPAGVTVGEAPFSPANVAGLGTWYAADTLVLNDADEVTSWSDASGNANTLVQGGVGDNPIYKVGILNGLPVVRFVSNDYLHAVPTNIPNGTAPFSIFVVASRGAGSINVLAQRSSGGNGWILRHGNGSDADYGRLTTPGVKDYDVDGVWPAASTFYVQTVIMDSSSDITFYRDGTSVGTSAHSAFGGATVSLLRVGSDASGWDGDVAELLIYNAEVSPSDRAAIEAYLGDKYAL